MPTSWWERANMRFRARIDIGRERAFDAIAQSDGRRRHHAWRRLALWDLVFAVHMIVIGR